MSDYTSTFTENTGDTIDTSDFSTEFDAIETAIATKAEMGDIWPIGSIYIATVATNPATLLGVGTWSAIGEGRVLVGVGTSDETYAAAATGGASTETAHNHGATGLTVSTNTDTTEVTAGAVSVQEAVHTHTISGNVANNSPSTGDNMPPYLVVYMWERTA